jgi:hypothetical protein
MEENKAPVYVGGETAAALLVTDAFTDSEKLNADDHIFRNALHTGFHRENDIILFVNILVKFT